MREPRSRPPSNGPFTGTVLIRQPQFGWTLASGQELRGEINGWIAGYQVWMSSRAEGGSTELVQGPCQVTGTIFSCSQVRLPGPQGTHEYILVAVVPDATAAQLTGASSLPVSGAPACDQTELYKG